MMAISLDFECMKNRMVKVFLQFAKEVMGDDISIPTLNIHKLDKRLDSFSFDGCLSEAIEIYILMLSLADSI